jgi:DNA polymerase
LARQVAGALDWWREAGVDLAFADQPQGWIKQAAEPDAPARHAPAAPVARAEPLVRIGGDPATWPQGLAKFAPWWLSEPSLDGGSVTGRVPPRGEAGAALLVLVEQPEEADTASLLSGPDGGLLKGFLTSAGIDSVYVASVLPRAMPHPDWAALAAQGLDAVLLHHLALAAPQRLLAFGGNILPLLGHDPAKSPEILLRLNQEGAQVPVLASRDLATLRARPAWKAGLWRRWLDWTG